MICVSMAIRRREAIESLKASNCSAASLQALADGPILDPARLYMPLGMITAAEGAHREAVSARPLNDAKSNGGSQ